MPFKTSIHSFSRQLSKSLINSNLSQVHYCVTHTRLVYLTCLFVYINFSCSAVYCVCFFFNLRIRFFLFFFFSFFLVCFVCSEILFFFFRFLVHFFYLYWISLFSIQKTYLSIHVFV